MFDWGNRTAVPVRHKPIQKDDNDAVPIPALSTFSCGYPYRVSRDRPNGPSPIASTS